MTVESTSAPKRTRPKNRREQILREAFALIAESGFNAVSLADIARAAGIQKSSVLHHFSSMNELLLAVLEMREQEDAVFYLEGASDLVPGPDSARALTTHVFNHNLERPGFSRLYSMLSAEALAPDHPAHDYFIDRDRNSRAEMTRLLSWKASPELAAVELLSFWSGLELAAQRDSRLDAKAVWNNFCDRFFA